jgi:antirestriction protein ArdC
MNVFWLWMVADMCGYASPFWMTYNQAKSLGAQVRKGEKSTIAIFYKSYTKEVEAPDTGEKTDEARRVLKAYPVFNADQVEGLPERFHPARDAWKWWSPKAAGRTRRLLCQCSGRPAASGRRSLL